jgi:hypothetical protein
MQHRFNKQFSSISLGILLFVFSCRTPYFKHPDETFPKIVIAEGGGFTGAVTYYWVLPNGQIFIKDGSDTTLVQANPMSKKEAQKLIKLVHSTLSGGETINEPDNIYRFISYIGSEGTLTSTWYRNRSELDELYYTILTKINEQNMVK